MNNGTWSFIRNPFETHTRNSNKKMLSLSTDMHSKLHGEISDAAILVIYNGLDPVFQAYTLIYGNYSVVTGERKGKTLDLVTQLSTLKETELAKWEVQVHNIYPKGTPAEVEIFPRSRTPFLQGTYEQRINAVRALYLKLAADAAFATLSTEVQSAYNVLLSARDTQQQKEGSLGQLATVREEQRVLLADALYGALGGLMVKFKSNREQITHYFDLSLLRNTDNGDEIIDTKQGSIPESGTVNLGPLPEGTTKVHMQVIGVGQQRFGLSVDATTFNGETVTLGDNGDTFAFVTDFASTGTQFIVKNLNGVPGEYKVEFIG